MTASGRLRDVLVARAGDVVRGGWRGVTELGAVRAGSARAARFGAFGDGSYLAFPQGALYGERWMRLGREVLAAPGVTLSVGMDPAQEMVSDPVLTIGDRVVLGRDTSVVAHFSIEIGDGVVTGPGVYVTDQNHAYADLDRPIGEQAEEEAPVVIGAGSWLGTGCVVLPGARIGSHVTVAANAVVTADVPDRCVVAGVPARIVRRHVDGAWRRIPEGEGRRGAG